MLMLVYQTYSANKKINMLFRCINELSCRIEDVADAATTVTVPQRSQQLSSLVQTQSKKMVKPKKNPQQSSNLPPVSPKIKVHPPSQAPVPTPVVSETIIFQVSPSPSQQVAATTTASTIEEIDSDSDVDVEETKMKEVDLDKALEAELSELNE